MTFNNLKMILAMVIACMWSFVTFAQITPDRLQRFISENKFINNASQVKEFYTRMNFKTTWIQKENSANCAFRWDY